MAYIKQIKAGTTTYDLKAEQLATARTIDGVSFNGTANIVHAGICTTDFSNTAKTVTITGYDTLTTNSIIWVAFTDGINSSTDITLNVNGTGAKNVTLAGDYSHQDYQWMYLDSYVPFLYNGTNWVLLPCGLSNYKVVKIKGNTNSFSLTTTKKILTLQTKVDDMGNINTSLFTLTGGGIQVKKSGFYRISGSCVVSLSNASALRQLYLEKVVDSVTWSTSNGEVINSAVCYTNNTGGAPFSVQPTVKYLGTDEKVYLVGLVSTGTGTANLTHNCTNLTIEYLGDPNYLA